MGRRKNKTKMQLQPCRKQTYQEVIWMKLDGIFWPVKVVTQTEEMMEIYIDSDNAQFEVKKQDKNIMPFYENFERLKAVGNDFLKKKRREKTLKAFLQDVAWAESLYDLEAPDRPITDGIQVESMADFGVQDESFTEEMVQVEFITDIVGEVESLTEEAPVLAKTLDDLKAPDRPITDGIQVESMADFGVQDESFTEEMVQVEFITDIVGEVEPLTEEAPVLSKTLDDLEAPDRPITDGIKVESMADFGVQDESFTVEPLTEEAPVLSKTLDDLEAPDRPITDGIQVESMADFGVQDESFTEEMVQVEFITDIVGEVEPLTEEAPVLAKTLDDLEAPDRPITDGIQVESMADFGVQESLRGEVVQVESITDEEAVLSQNKEPESTTDTMCISDSEYESDTIPVSFDKFLKVSHSSGEKRPHSKVDYDDVENDIDCDLSEDEILRDKRNPKLFIRKVLTSTTTKLGKKKKDDRVYNSYHNCTYCDELWSNFSQHMKRRHLEEADVGKIYAINDDKKRSRQIALLSAEMDHVHNMKVKKKEGGEILLFRRPSKDFQFDSFGPCPSCFLWISKRMLRRHQKVCIRNNEKELNYSELITRSDTLADRISDVASSVLVEEVFRKMNNDDIGIIAREDNLIVRLGNMWMDKNHGNKLKRGKYTSQIMRMVARLLINIQKETNTDLSLSEYLKPCYFDDIARATLITAGRDVTDNDYLENPSNAIKLGHDIKRIANIKIGVAIMVKDRAAEEDAERFLKLMSVFWGTRVTKLARNTLVERQFNKRQVLPDSGSEFRLYECLVEHCEKADLSYPQRITATALRKYMATVTQALDLKPHQIDWVMRHMGHSLDVHKIYYRSTSDIIERTQVAKILLFQDTGRLDEFANQSLEDIQLSELAEDAGGNPDDVPLEELFVASEDMNEDEDTDEDYTNLAGSSETRPGHRAKKNSAVTRQKWSSDEEKEIRQIFEKCFEEKRRPTPKQCSKAMRISKKKGGAIHLRKKDVLKKKVYRMIDNSKK